MRLISFGGVSVSFSVVNWLVLADNKNGIMAQRRMTP
jgi:hypothetical protein